MDDFYLFKVSEGIEYLYGEGPNVAHIERRKVIGFEQFIQADGEQFSYYADMFLENDKILNS